MRALAVALLLAGCASATKTYTQDGKEGFVLNCSGTARNWGMCMEKAGELCGTRGYEVLSRDGEQGFLAGGSASGNSASVGASSLHYRTMVVRCK